MSSPQLSALWADSQWLGRLWYLDPRPDHSEVSAPLTTPKWGRKTRGTQEELSGPQEGGQGPDFRMTKGSKPCPCGLQPDGM